MLASNVEAFGFVCLGEMKCYVKKRLIIHPESWVLVPIGSDLLDCNFIMPFVAQTNKI
jgi:hypothetical protein